MSPQFSNFFSKFSNPNAKFSGSVGSDSPFLPHRSQRCDRTGRCDRGGRTRAPLHNHEGHVSTIPLLARLLHRRLALHCRALGANGKRVCPRRGCAGEGRTVDQRGTHSAAQEHQRVGDRAADHNVMRLPSISTRTRMLTRLCFPPAPRAFLFCHKAKCPLHSLSFYEDLGP